jgi:hypothetical protein
LKKQFLKTQLCVLQNGSLTFKSEILNQIVENEMVGNYIFQKLHFENVENLPFQIAVKGDAFLKTLNFKG